MNKVLLMGLLLVGCAPATSLRQVDPQLEQYVATFEYYAGYPIKFSVQMGDMDHTIAGYCNYRPDTGVPYITISKYAWPLLNNSGREQLILHELGHCQLGRGHSTAVDSFGNPSSIMWPVVFGNTTPYTINRDALIKELFGR